MVWLKPSEYENQEFTVLRLYAPESEKIFRTNDGKTFYGI